MSAITPAEIRSYVQSKLAERDAIERERAAAVERGERYTRRPLSNSSINKTVSHLRRILEDAVEVDELLATNPARGRRLRLQASKPARPWVEPEQLMTFLASAPNDVGKVLLAILAGGGLRIGEALSLRWQHVDLGTGTLHVVESKTDAGVRCTSPRVA